MATSLASHGTDGFPTEIRDAPPANYVLKIKSFNLIQRNKMEKYETNDFEAGGYKWKLTVYPHGNKGANVDDHISLYLGISNPSTLKFGGTINVTFMFFVYDQIRDKYLGVQGGTRRFHAMKSEWGIPKFISLKAFNEPSNGYLVDDCCVFGVEVFVIKSCGAGECLVLRKPEAYKHQWHITNFSALGEHCYSEEFTADSEIKWKILLYPNGNKSNRGRNVSMFLYLADEDKFPPAKKLLVEYSLCIKDLYGEVHKKLQGNGWFDAKYHNWGWFSFLPLDSMRALLNRDRCIIEAEVTELGIVDQLP